MHRFEIEKIWDFDKYGDRCALISDEEQSISYKTLKEASDLVADAIDERCLVFSLCNNEIGSIIGYVGFVNNGIVPALLSTHLDEDLLNSLFDIYAPSFIWLPDDQIEKYAQFSVVLRSYGYALMRTNYEKKYSLYSELALLLTTSGSTGSPKFVRQSYTNIKANTNSIIQYLELDSSERPITTLPMNYTYGLSIINTHLAVGATILLTDKTLMQKEFWTFFKEQKATSFGGVPYTYEMLDKLRFMRMDLPTLRTMTQAGGKITPELHEKFAQFAFENNKKFIVMYGQCEATARMGYLPPESAVQKKGSMGIAILGGSFSLIDIDGNEITNPNTPGELVYKGANVTLGYAENGNDLVKGDERNGVLITGDMAQFDDEGFYYIVGRKKRFLKIYGNRVNLDEIDRMIKAEYNIEVASSGIDDCMYIFVTESDKADSVRNYVIGKTKLNPVAFKVIVIDEIPKNDSGKTLYRELTKYYIK
ncbi:MAG: AMP-binding protein [Lachnospiraceae bacterium]|nr:AMP-binding protein [Lachnospiraceae bacterium]